MKSQIIIFFISRAQNANTKESLSLTLFEDDLVNKFKIQNSAGEIQVIWFQAEVPARQWNSMCITRDITDKHFEIYQNNENVYSYGHCKTVGPVYGYYKNQVKDEDCHQHSEWELNVNTFFFYFFDFQKTHRQTITVLS